MFCHCQQLNSSTIKTDSELRAKRYKGESNFQIPALLYCHLSHASKLIAFCWHQHSAVTSNCPELIGMTWGWCCSQMLPVKTFYSDFLRLCLTLLALVPLVSNHCSVPWWGELGDAGVGNYCLIPELLIKVTPTDNTSHNLATEYRLSKLTLQSHKSHFDSFLLTVQDGRASQHFLIPVCKFLHFFFFTLIPIVL